jgi:hypothetical protein
MDEVFQAGDDVRATRSHGGLLGRAVRPGAIGTVEGIRAKDGRPVVQWADGKTRLSSDASLAKVAPQAGGGECDG